MDICLKTDDISRGFSVNKNRPGELFISVFRTNGTLLQKRFLKILVYLDLDKERRGRLKTKNGFGQHSTIERLKMRLSAKAL